MTENAYTWKRDSFLSADGIHSVATYRMEPQETPRAIVQLCHGMCEHMGRYEEFAAYLCRHGFAVGGHDHLGHGHTARSAEELGYTAKKDGVDRMLQDLHTMTDVLRRGREEIPVILFGHSMGSFFVRLYLATYPHDVNAAVICGTAGPEAPAGMGRVLASMNAAIFGEYNRSTFLYGLSVGAYEKKFPKGSPKHLWISGDARVREAYAADPFCSFRFTARAYHDLFDVLNRVSKKSWAGKLSRELPTLLVAGEQDPVGNFGKGVRTVYRRMQEAGMRHLTLRLYAGDHHEILNERDREQVYADLLAWMTACTLGGN